MSHNIVIIGGGAGGIATAASLLKRDASLNISIIEPQNEHYYQPGWTMVGGGIFSQAETARSMQSLIPSGATWLQASVSSFQPEQNQVTLDNGDTINYDILVVSPGLQLDWGKVAGLEETLGKNGVTSNYRYDLAPYTWELVQNLKAGTALFTQPPMPIKCAGAPQKAMYLSGSHWAKTGVLNDINISFYNAGPGLFGVADYIPALMEYVKKYRASLEFSHNLIAVDGDKKIATFAGKDADGNDVTVEREFDMLHVCPPQSAPDFIKASPLANEAGWLDVDQGSLQHSQHKNIFGVGDCTSTPNAKTAGAVRQQAPIVAENIVRLLNSKALLSCYGGYGSCPLTVEHGKIVLAEFSYGGKVTPTFPTWLLNGLVPTRLAWFLKAKVLPYVYFNRMLKGKEWLAEPKD
ncbi:FAD/NAD(P)-binding oxidoreductase [Dasania marina]|uniref:NAD(P)/FAD-dependent oxidoreductase n=1 Tax=Dasania marina TaxID=471499 RepID=UPI0030DDB171|tara:strand:+ start:75828 stop:77048 length:1221 start_codon:yes stop_codon:yes gene_type:complete